MARAGSDTLASSGPAEFELRRGGASDPFKWKALVKSGKATFIPQAGEGGGASVASASAEQVIQAGDMLARSAGGTAINSIGIKEMKLQTAWAASARRAASPLSSKPFIGATLAAGLIVAAAMTVSSLIPNTVTIASPPADQWKMGVWLGFENIDGSGWGRKLVSECQASSPNAEGWSVINAKFTEARLIETLPDGSTVDLPDTAFETFAESAAFKFEMPSDGAGLRALEMTSGADSIPAAAVLETVLRASALLSPGKTVKQNERWSVNGATELALQPSASLAWRGNFAFVGHETGPQGQRLAKIAFTRDWTVEQMNCAVGENTFAIDFLHLSEEGALFVDAATGQPVKIESALQVENFRGTGELPDMPLWRFIMFWEY
jgi:hypothetical protein